MGDVDGFKNCSCRFLAGTMRWWWHSQRGDSTEVIGGFKVEVVAESRFEVVDMGR